MPSINVNTDAVVALTHRLERMRKHDFPVTVRRSLNSVAFINKKQDLPDQYQKTFIQRNKAAVRFFTRVTTAKGLNPSSMFSSSGFQDKGLSFTDDMVKQEFGGTLDRSKIANTKARTSKSNAKGVAAKNRLSNIGSLRNRAIRKGNKKKFIKAAHAAGKGGFVKYGNTIFMINSLNRGKIKSTPIYSDVPNRKVKIKATGFIRSSGITSGRKMESIYIREAKKRIFGK